MTKEIKKFEDTCAFSVETWAGDRFFIDVSTFKIEDDFFEVPTHALMIIEQIDPKTKQPVVGLVKVKEGKAVESSIYVEKTGAIISQISRNSAMGKTIVNARSGGLII